MDDQDTGDDDYRKEARREFREHPIKISLHMAVVLGCPLLALYADRTYPPLEPTHRALWTVLAGVYIVSALFFFRYSQEGAPGYQARPLIRLVAVVGLPVVAVMGAEGLIAIANATLDDSEPYALQSTVTGFFKPYRSRGRLVESPNEVSVAISPPGPTPVWIRLTEDERRIVGVGSTIYLKVHKGAFGIPWFSSHTRPSVAPPSPRADGIPNLPPHKSQFDDTIFEPLKVPPHDPFGYPADLTDKRILLAYLRAKQYAQLDRFLDSLQRDLDRDIRNEYRFWDALQAFEQDDPTLEPALTAWIQQRPRSAHARAARATYYLSRAWQSRGDAYANELSASQVAGMRHYVDLSFKDARVALTQDSTHLAAYTAQLGDLLLEGDNELADDVLARGLRTHPGSYILRERYSALLYPNWGGSERALEIFGAAGAKDAGLNPRLATLQGMVHDWHATQAFRRHDYAAVVAEENEAMAFGPEREYLTQRAAAYFRTRDYDRALDDLERALQQRPQQLTILKRHAVALYYMSTGVATPPRQKALQRSIDEFQLLQQLDPTDTASATWITFLHTSQHCAGNDRPCRWRDGPDRQ